MVGTDLGFDSSFFVVAFTCSVCSNIYNAGVEEDNFEYGGRSTRSEVKSVTLSDNHTPNNVVRKFCL